MGKAEAIAPNLKKAGDPPIIAVEGLDACFGEVTILEKVSFEVRRGEILCIVGGSGCGKSTLLKHMIGLLRPAAGTVLVEGVDIAAAGEELLNSIRREIGVLFQSDALLASMTLEENVGLPLEGLSALSRETVRTIVLMKLAMVNLKGCENYYPAELSGGMRKRGGLARAMVLDPKVLFFDEPTAGLDPINTAELEKLIREINTGLGTTIVIVSHQVDLVRRLADRVMLIDRCEKGIIAMGAPEELRDSATDPRVREYLFRPDAGQGKG
jgi:phospholipid/cholesterol/gamma-HCH transport system ATP-binding protein